MSDNYDNSNSGALFRNKDKDPNKDTDRDFSGNMEVTCPHCNKSADHWISAWTNEAKSGQKYMKLKFNAKEEEKKPTQKRELNEDGDGFDDIPF